MKKSDNVVEKEKKAKKVKQEKKQVKESKSINRKGNSFRRANSKLKKFFSMFSISNLKGEVKTLGYEITTKNIMILLFALIFAGFISSFLLKLEWRFVLLLIVFFIMCLPSLVITKFKHDFEKRRFNDIVSYMEQLIYAFHKSGKIRSALQDVYEVSTGHIKYLVKRMLDIIDNDMTTSKLYEKAFALIYSEYNCTRLKTLQDYLLTVENNGGKAAVSLNILLEDIRAWSERVLTYQADRKSIQTKTAVSIFCAMFSCGIMINLIPADYSSQIVASNVYQVATCVILMLNVLIYIIAANKVCMSYLDNELNRGKAVIVKSQIQYLADWANKNHFKTSIIKCALCVPVLALCLYYKFNYLVLPVAIVMIFMLIHDFMYKAACVKSVTREIKKLFPVWLRNLVLYLQVDNVHVAIRNSYENCPDLLKPEVASLISNLEKDPVTMKPYNRFLKAYSVPELELAVHYLYSIATFGSDDMLAQLDYLIQQNNKLEIVEENIRNEDSIASFSLIILAPMLLAVAKLMVDLVMFLGIFMGYLSSAGGM